MGNIYPRSLQKFPAEKKIAILAIIRDRFNCLQEIHKVLYFTNLTELFIILFCSGRLENKIIFVMSLVA